MKQIRPSRARIPWVDLSWRRQQSISHRSNSSGLLYESQPSHTDDGAGKAGCTYAPAASRAIEKERASFSHHRSARTSRRSLHQFLVVGFTWTLCGPHLLCDLDARFGVTSARFCGAMPNLFFKSATLALRLSPPFVRPASRSG